MTDRETIARYDAAASEYAKVTGNVASDPHLISFIDRLPKGGSVLDLGCGPGITSAAMANAGLLCDAFDASSEMVKLANAHPGVTAWTAGFDDLDADGLYDGVFANFSLLHADRADMPRHLAAIHKALKPGGQFHIGMKTGNTSKRDTLGRMYTYYTVDDLSDLLAQSGFTVTQTSTGCDLGLDGVMADWVVLAAHG